MRSKKNMVIGILCLTLVFMGIGYSLFSSTLNITGASQGSGTFDVKITNVEVDLNNTTSGATNTMESVGNDYAVTETTLSATFNAPGDYITYDITVTNRGSIDAVISVETNMLDSTNSFELSCTVQEGTEVLANNHITFPCVMRFKESVDSLSNIETAHMRVSLKAVQKAAYTPPAAQTTPDSCFISVIPGEINGYSTSDPDCSTDVVIPDNLTLGVREITSMEFDDAKCSQFESALVSLNENYTCANLKAQYNSISSNPQVVFSSFIGQLTASTYGEEGQEKHSITKIADGAFSGKQLTSATIGEGIETIGLSSFAFNSISTLSLPSTLETIGTVAFINNSLTSVTIPNSVTSIGESAFDENLLTGALTIPASVTSIGDLAFYASSSGSENQITSVVFESGSHLQTIGRYAFCGNALTGTLTIPSSVTSIGDSAFSGNQITTLAFESGSHLQTIGEGAFRDNALTGTLTIPSSVTSIGDSAFRDNALTGTLTIPASVTSIGEWAFYGSSSGSGNQITSLVFESGSHLETIGEGAFQHNALTGTLTIPSSVTSIGEWAFSGSWNSPSNQITSLVFESGSHLQTIGLGAFQDNALTGTLTIPASVTSIGNQAFFDESNGTTNQISSVVFESGSHLLSIGDWAFHNNSLTGTLTIPASVISIGGEAFSNSYNSSANQITSLVFENGSQLQTIGLSAFEYNQISGTLTIPSSVTSIGDYAFYDNLIEELHLGSAITNIAYRAFYTRNSTDLKDVYVDMTESDWNNSVTKGSSLFNGTPTMHYN